MQGADHLSIAELEAGLAHIRQSPKDRGILELIVCRPQSGERRILGQATLDLVKGLLGDDWHSRGSTKTPDGSANPETQITLMNSRCIALLAREKSRWGLAGDQLFVDLDLSLENLRPGTQLAIGSAILEITPPPHTGCKKFVSRFGLDAMQFVNSPLGRQLNLRGVNARIRQAGTVKTGDPAVKVCALLLLLFSLVFNFIAPSAHAAPLPSDVYRFVTNKDAEAHALAKKLDLNVSKDMWAFFRTAASGDIPATTNAFERLKKRSSQYEGSKDDPTIGTPVWQEAIEVLLIIEAVADPGWPYSQALAKNVIDSIPPGSIYFGGTDPGRGLITALSKSHARADPFFTLTQNALADSRYLEYLRALYGDRIHIPDITELQSAFQTYTEDASRRLKHDQTEPGEPKQLTPGEDVRLVNGRVQVSGQVAVMSINGLLVRDIFEANSNRQYYVEESFPLDWMYPFLSPHGFIMKLNRDEMKSLPDELIQKDREFWLQQQQKLIGDWLKPETSVKDVCTFAQKVFGKGDLSNFKGDPKFIHSHYATTCYSKLRSSIGGLYAWRMNKAKSAEERSRMTEEADFAFRQAFCLCPFSPEAIFRYVNLLLSQNRPQDALRLALTANALDPDNAQLADLVKNLDRAQRNQKK